MGDFIVLAAIAVVCGFVIRSMIKKRKKGSSCCGCSGCDRNGRCDMQNKE